MSISLEKGVNHVIEKTTQTANVGLGWDVNKAGNGNDFDLDAAVFALNENDKLDSESNFVYFNNKHPGIGIDHSGDNLTGAGDGDDEVITVDFSKVPATVKKIAVVVSIYKGAERHQNFGQVKNAFVRLVDTTNGANTEQLRFDLTEDYSGDTAIHMADLYRHNDGWKMKAIGEGIKGDLSTFLQQYK